MKTCPICNQAQESELVAQLRFLTAELEAHGNTLAFVRGALRDANERAETAEASLATVREETIRKCAEVAKAEIIEANDDYECDIAAKIRNAILSQLSEKGR